MNTPKYLTSRKYPRYDFTSPVEFDLLSRSGKKSYQGMSVNLSRTGMGLVSPLQVQNGQEIQIRSNLPAYSQRAIIRWSMNLNDVLCRAGAEFDHREVAEDQNIDAVLSLLKGLDTLKHMQPQMKLEHSLGGFLEKLQHSNTQLMKRNEELSAIHQLTRHINSSLSVDEVIAFALTEIMEIIAPDITFFYLRQDNLLVLKDSRQVSMTNSLELPKTKNIGECLCGLAAREGTPYYSRNIHIDPLCTLDECKQAGIRSFAALPLRKGEQVLGVLSLASFQERDFGRRRAFLEILAGHIALALQNAFLYKQIQGHAENLETHLAERKKTEEALKQSRTEILEKVRELESFYDMAVGRELRMIELKEQMEELKEELKRARRTGS
ncbi:MAG: GAF domain-containing protein [Nitrospirota bacterium]